MPADRVRMKVGDRHDHHEEGDFPPHGVCAASARRWRCRCSTAMVPALTALQTTPAKPVNRFGVMYVPNGMIMDKWTPAPKAPPSS